MEAKEKDDESLLIEELNGISSGKINLSVIQDRKDLLDSIVNSLVTAKVLDGAPQSGLTDTFRDIWAQLRTLQSHEDAKELLATITSLHDDLSLLDAASKSFLAPAEDAKQSPAAPVHAKRADERDVLSLVETMHGKCRRIVEQAGRCWESDQGRLENSKKYFDTDRIAKVVQGLENILNSIVQNALENIKWPMQKIPDGNADDPQFRAQESVRRVLELIGQKSFVGDAHSLHLDAIEGFSKTVERLALFLVRHYVDRLRLRLQYHFGAEQETGKNDRPALILRYVLDQIRTFRGYVEQLGVAHAFPVIRDQLLNEVMLILMGKYKETQVRLKEVIRVFFIYLEEVSLFQAKLKDLFGYSCDEQHSLFYFILNDNINGEQVSEVWKIVDRKLAEKRVAEIVETIEPKTGEEIETLLEHYIKSYSTLPPELRANFYHNSEEFVLQRVVNDLGNRLINFDYRQLLHKRPCRDVIEFALALDKTVKGVMRQRETVGDEQIRRLYQDHIDGLIRVRSKLYESCANHITRALLDVLRQDFEISRDTSTRIDRFSKCTRQVVDVFFKKLLAVDLFQAVSEIQEIVRRYILKHLDGENWTKVLARFQKESIKQQLMELADIFVGALNNKKEVEMYDDWKRRVDQALSK